MSDRDELVLCLKMAEQLAFDPRHKSTFRQAHEAIRELERELAALRETPRTDALLAVTTGACIPIDAIDLLRQLERELEESKDAEMVARERFETAIAENATLREATIEECAKFLEDRFADKYRADALRALKSSS